MKRCLSIVFLLAMLVACAPPADDGGAAAPDQAAKAAPAQTAPAVQMPEKVARAVELARAIEADPDAADRILEEHGMSRQDFESLLYEIAEDPELSRAYAEAMGK